MPTYGHVPCVWLFTTKRGNGAATRLAAESPQNIMAAEPETKANVRGSVDMDAFGHFVEYAAANPADVQFELEAQGISEGRVAHTTASTGPYTLGGQRIDRLAREYTTHFGAHKEVEAALGFVDPTDREEVIEAALAALTGCINTAVSMSAAIRGIDLDTLETTVKIGWDPFVFLHLEDPESDGEPTDQYGRLEVELVIDGEDLDQEDVAYIQESVKRSAVYNIFTMAHEASPVVKLAGESRPGRGRSER